MEPTTVFLLIALKVNPDNINESSPVQNYTVVRSTGLDQSVVIGPAWVNTQESDNGYTIDFGSNFEEPIAFLLDFSSQKDLSKPQRIKISYPSAIDEQIQNQDLSKIASEKFLRYRHDVFCDTAGPNMVSSDGSSKTFVWFGGQTSTQYFRNSIVMRMNTGQSASFHVSFYDIADVNMDGMVNGADLSYVISAWDTPNGDLNGDGVTDAQDLTIFASSWR